MTTNQTTQDLTPEQEAAFTRLAERMADFVAEGVERFGSLDAFAAALATYNRTR
jgi:hypothetical protein